MASERVQRQIDRLLDQVEMEAERENWERVGQLAEQVLAFAPDNDDAKSFLEAAKRVFASQGDSVAVQTDELAVTRSASHDQPSSFANGRYVVKRFLGEGGKKKVYLAQDTLLDREVAFALIKTEGLDETSRTRIQREAQAMGRLGSHPHAEP